MSETETLPPAWRKLFERANIPSQNRLAEDAGISTATVNRMIRGGGTSPESIRKVAEILSGGDTEEIYEAMQRTERDFGDFPVHLIDQDLRLLTPKQRKALIAMVRSMAYPEREAGSGHGNNLDEKSDEQFPVGEGDEGVTLL